MTWPNYSPATRRAVNDLLKRGGSLSAYRANKDFGSGPVEGSYAWKLEREIEKRFKVRHAVVVNSGTAALHAGLAAALNPDGRNSGEIITSPYTFSATAAAIVHAGFRPVFADVDPHTFCITKETVAKVITKRTKAILPVHLFGGLADVKEISSLGFPVVEDACQAVGARVSSGYSGSLGIAGAYSFNGGKNVPAGESGCLVTNSSLVAERARLLMNHAENFGADYVGLNYRPNELTACVAYHGLLELEERNGRRQALAERLSRAIWAWNSEKRIVDTPSWRETDHVFYCYPFTLNLGGKRPPNRRDKRYKGAQFIKRMAEKGVTVGGGYINPTLNRYKAFRQYQRGPLPVVEKLSGESLFLLYDLTPDKPLSYAADVARKMRECLE